MSQPPLATVKDPAVREVLAHYLQALGGVGILRGEHSAVERANVSIDPYGVEMNAVAYMQEPEKIRTEVSSTKTGKRVTVVNGTKGWRDFEHMGFGWLSASEVATTLRDQSLHGDDLGLAWNFPKQARLPDETIAGDTLQVLALTRRDGVREKWYFDPKSGRCVRREVPEAGQSSSVMTFADFRTVQGVVIPYMTTIKQQGMTITLLDQSVELNPKLDDALFDPPKEEAAHSVAIENVLDRYVAAWGTTKHRTSVTKMAVLNQGSGVQTLSVVYQKRPGEVLVERTSSGLGKTTLGFDGKTGWESSDLRGYRGLRGAELAQLKSAYELDGPARMQWKYPLRQWLGERDVDGHKAVAVKLSTTQAPGGTYVFGQKTGRLLEIIGVINNGAQGYLPVTSRFSDFRTQDGVTMPFKTTITNPAVQVIVTVQSVKYDQPLDDAMFAPRKG